ncbi:MAG: NAD(P) transhydrogenase subunit alpha [Bacilli bacterium]|nr:NAD(P) transhydrogenase subunit alpha [Bacilli bacterium]MDD4077332.1 NAD(P) transhydrogenase subunit alpha [Bacilli bacterium]MDD4388549.1 NAD(P) transhydrogenase subunit alpha [Bacilli bacterium]
MIIGILKEIMQGERRVAGTPETVKKMVETGAAVLVETKAGDASFYSDDAYLEAGAILVDDPEAIYERAEVILKVKEPRFNHNKNKHEIDMMHPGQYLITFIHPAAPANHELVSRMAEKGIIGLTLDGVPRISRAQTMDALSSMSACAGYKGMIMAIDEISKFVPPMASAVGMLRPATVLVVGAGVAGLRAVATAKSLGAAVYAADIRPEACEQAKSLGARIIDLGVPAAVAVSADRKYASSLSEEWLTVERKNLEEKIAQADIVFLSALVPGKLSPIIVTETMVKAMMPGSCIVDISIDQGGNCEITPPGAKEIRHGVMIIGIKNIPGMIPTSSTWMFAHNVYNLLTYITKKDKIELDINDEIVASILVTKDGKILHAGALEAMGASQ